MKTCLSLILILLAIAGVYQGFLEKNTLYYFTSVTLLGGIAGIWMAPKSRINID